MCLRLNPASNQFHQISNSLIRSFNLTHSSTQTHTGNHRAIMGSGKYQTLRSFLPHAPHPLTRHHITAFSTLNSWIHAVQTLRSGYLLTWGWLFGSNIWMSYISGPIAYTTIPRQQFGLLQSKLFPPYFYGSAILSAALFLGDIKLRPILYQQLKSKPFSTSYSMISSGSFWMSTAGLALATTTLHLANAVVVGPKATEVMFRRHRLERSGSGGKATDPHVS